MILMDSCQSVPQTSSQSIERLASGLEDRSHRPSERRPPAQRQPPRLRESPRLAVRELAGVKVKPVKKNFSFLETRVFFACGSIEIAPLSEGGP